jgi:hypothetical protein
MVQRQNPLPGGDFYSRESWSRNERYIPQENQFTSAPPPTPTHTSIHPRVQVCFSILQVRLLLTCKTIEDALKLCAEIPVKAYALIVRLENDEDRIYTSPSLTPFRERIFTDAFKTNFRRSVKRATATLVDNNFPNPGRPSNHPPFPDANIASSLQQPRWSVQRF